MQTPYDLYLRQREKEALDLGAIAHGVQSAIPAIQHGAGQLFGHGIIPEFAYSAALGHVGLNAAIKAKDKFLPQIGRMGNKKGLVHGLTGRTLRPGLHEAAGLAVGKDTVGLDYDAGKNLAKTVLNHKMVGGDPEKALQIIQEGARNPVFKELASQNHALSNLHHAAKDVKPSDLGRRSILSNVFTTADNSVGGKREGLVRGAVRLAGTVGTGIAGLATGSHELTHAAAIGAVNAGRAALGTSPAGKAWTANELQKGVRGQKRTPLGEIATNLFLSPSAAEVRHVGQAARDAGVRIGQEAQGVANNFQHGVDVQDSVSGFLNKSLGLGQNLSKQVGHYAQQASTLKDEAPGMINNLAAMAPKQPERRLPSITDRKITPGVAAATAAATGVGMAAPAMFDTVNGANQSINQDNRRDQIEAQQQQPMKAASFPMDAAVRSHARYLEAKIGGCETDGLLERAIARARERGRNKIIMNDIRAVHHENRSTKEAATIFLGGKVSGKDGNWREEVKGDLREAGHKVIDPKKPADQWDPAKDIYREIKQILGADKVFFYKGGYFTKKEKEVCQAAGKDYEVVKRPEEVVEKAAFNAVVPVDLVGIHTRTPSAFPEDRRGRMLTTLHAAQMSDTMGMSLARYLRTQSIAKASPHDLAVLMSLVHMSR